eukprot:COSAG05_NODE_147_length_16383_cov_266.102555_26_plen_149_part_00
MPPCHPQVVGGSDSSGALATADLYDPYWTPPSSSSQNSPDNNDNDNTNSSSALHALPTAGHPFEERGYGGTATCTEKEREERSEDAAGLPGGWVSLPHMSTKRTDCAAAQRADGAVLVIGGHDGVAARADAELLAIEQVRALAAAKIY